MPILLPGSFFKSYVANKQFGGETLLKIDNVHMTTFMLAVQEANFLYSFTLAAFSALATFLSSHQETGQSLVLTVLSGVYSIFGICVAVWMYGRKTERIQNFPVEPLISA